MASKDSSAAAAAGGMTSSEKEARNGSLTNGKVVAAVVTAEQQIFESIIDDIGPLGKWQWGIALCNIVMTITASIHTMNYPMLVGTNREWSYSCSANRTLPPAPGQKSCTIVLDSGREKECMDVPGAAMVYHSEYFGDTVTTDFDLMCGRLRHLAPLVHSAFTIGCFFGVFLFGWLADCYGRKRVLCCGGIPVMIVLNFGLAFSPNIVVFLVVRLLQGLFVFGAFTVMYILTMETTSESKRAMLGNVVHIPWGLQFITVALIAWLIKDWRVQQLVQSVVSLSCLVVFTPLLPESPRWLALQGRIQPATQLLVTGAKRNGTFRNVDQNSIQQRLEKLYLVHTSGPKVSNVSLALGLVKTPKMRKRFLLSTVVWFQGALTNHGFNFYTPMLAKDPFWSYSIAGVAEFLAPTAGAFLFTWGRRIPITISYFVCAIVSLMILGNLCITSEGSELWNAVQMGLLLFGVFLSDMTFNGIYVYMSELMPTTHRSIGLGSCSSMARIGSTLSSYVVMLHDRSFLLPPLLFAAASLAGSSCAFLLPSTETNSLPDTIGDVELGDCDSGGGDVIIGAGGDVIIGQAGDDVILRDPQIIKRSINNSTAVYETAT